MNLIKKTFLLPLWRSEIIAYDRILKVFTEFKTLFVSESSECYDPGKDWEWFIKSKKSNKKYSHDKYPKSQYERYDSLKITTLKIFFLTQEAQSSSSNTKNNNPEESNSQ